MKNYKKNTIEITRGTSEHKRTKEEEPTKEFSVCNCHTALVQAQMGQDMPKIPRIFRLRLQCI